MSLPDHLFTAIDHVGIAVPDLDEAIAFYRDTFGMQPWCTRRPTRSRASARRWSRWATPGSCIQLLAPADPRLDDREVPRPLRPGMQQLAYRVEDVEAVSAVLRERGLRLLYDEPRRGTSGSRVNFVHPKDAGGVLIELVEPA